MNRRDLIKAFAAAAPLTVAGRVWAAPATDARLLVVFLRGAYDAANVVVPVSIDFYHTSRPTLGIAKPDPEIYIYTCEKLGVAPSEALFLDDKIENIEAAHHVGLHAIQFTNVHKLQQDLASSGLFSNLPIPGTVPERSTRA